MYYLVSKEVNKIVINGITIVDFLFPNHFTILLKMKGNRVPDACSDHVPNDFQVPVFGLDMKQSRTIY